MKFTYSYRKMAKLLANSGDLDQTLHSAASDQGLHCLPITLLRVSRLQWVKVPFKLVADDIIFFFLYIYFPENNAWRIMARQTIHIKCKALFSQIIFQSPGHNQSCFGQNLKNKINK